MLEKKGPEKHAVLYPRVSLPATTRKQVGCTNRIASNPELLDSAELWEFNGKADKKSQLTVSVKKLCKMKENYFEHRILAVSQVFFLIFCKESSFKTIK